MPHFSNNKTWYIDLFWLTLLIGFVFSLMLGMPALTLPDEARYAEIPREMLSMHEFIVPHLNGLMYFEKPPLPYWLVAGFIKLFGYNEWAVRGAVATLGLLGCLATYATARKLFNRRTGILSALILSSSLLYFIMSHLNTTDMALSFFLTLSLYSFLFAFQTDKPTTTWLLTGYFFSGLAMMAKGLIGIVFPAAIIFFWIAVMQRWALIRTMRIFTGCLLILAINLPWVVLAQQKEADFFHFYFIVQQLERYATPIAGREMSKMLYLTILFAAFFPWIVFLPQTLKHHFSQLKQRKIAQQNLLYLGVWPLFIVVFFLFSHSILIPYLLPIIAPLAILVAKYLDEKLALAHCTKNEKISLYAYGFINIMLCIGFFVCFQKNTLSNNFLIGTSIIALLVISLQSFILPLEKSLRRIIGFVLISGYVSLILIWLNYANDNNISKSIKPLAHTINQLIKQYPNAEIATFRSYYQDLPYYTHHIITVVNFMNELEFGATHDKKSKTWMVDEAHFWKQWNSEQRIYLVASQKQYHQWLSTHHNKMYLIQETKNDTLICNKDPNA